jgi:hypothetical protein
MAILEVVVFGAGTICESAATGFLPYTAGDAAALAAAPAPASRDAGHNWKHL